jgi:hypothetical protein
VLFLASIAGFIHAFTTPRDERVLTGSSQPQEPPVPVG